MSVMPRLHRQGMGLSPGPAGLAIPEIGQLFADLGSKLSLPDLGVYTPWATRVGGIQWDLVSQPPGTNVAIASLTDVAWKMALGVGFGQALPFIGVLSERLPEVSVLERSWIGTQYEVYETQAVYAQTDQAPTPRIQFLTWLSLRAPGDGDKGSGSLEQAAVESGGRLVFATQVDYRSTATRGVPGMPFLGALEEQLGGGGQPGERPPPPPVDPIGPPPVVDPGAAAPSEGGVSWAPIAALVGAAVVTFFVGKRVLGGPAQSSGWKRVRGSSTEYKLLS